MRAEQNERVTRIGPDTPCGQVLRHYWHPVALLDEFNAALDPRMGIRPVKAVKLLGQDLVLFKNAQGAFGLLDRDCPHRGADLAYGRNEGDGLRCPFHGWTFGNTGKLLKVKDPEGAAKAVVAADTSGSASLKVQKRQMENVAKLITNAGTKKIGYLEPAAYERTVKVLLAGGSDPVIKKDPGKAAYSHAIYDAAQK